MMQEPMAFRCPEAELIGIGQLSGARLEFYLHATVEKTGNEQDRVPVAVWEISESDERSLDRYEDFPDYYIKEQWPVQMEDGSETDGMIYLMKRIRMIPPESRYYDGIANAYRRLGLEEQIDTVLKPALERSRARSKGERADL